MNTVSTTTSSSSSFYRGTTTLTVESTPRKRTDSGIYNGPPEPVTITRASSTETLEDSNLLKIYTQFIGQVRSFTGELQTTNGTFKLERSRSALSTEANTKYTKIFESQDQKSIEFDAEKGRIASLAKKLIEQKEREIRKIQFQQECTQTMIVGKSTFLKFNNPWTFGFRKAMTVGKRWGVDHRCYQIRKKLDDQAREMGIKTSSLINVNIENIIEPARGLSSVLDETKLCAIQIARLKESSAWVKQAVFILMDRETALETYVQNLEQLRNYDTPINNLVERKKESIIQLNTFINNKSHKDSVLLNSYKIEKAEIEELFFRIEKRYKGIEGLLIEQKNHFVFSEEEIEAASIAKGSKAKIGTDSKAKGPEEQASAAKNSELTIEYFIKFVDDVLQTKETIILNTFKANWEILDKEARRIILERGYGQLERLTQTREKIKEKQVEFNNISNKKIEELRLSIDIIELNRTQAEEVSNEMRLKVKWRIWDKKTPAEAADTPSLESSSPRLSITSSSQVSTSPTLASSAATTHRRSSERKESLE